MKKADAEKLTEILTNIHKGVVLEATKKKGKPPTQYKKFEPHKIQRFFESYNPDNKTIFDVAADVISTLLRADPFPNANHRTMLLVAKASSGQTSSVFPGTRARSRSGNATM